MSKVSNLSDLLQRVTASCLLHPLAGAERHENSDDDAGRDGVEEVYEYETDEYEEEEEEEEDEEIEAVEKSTGGSSSSKRSHNGVKYKKRVGDEAGTKAMVAEMEMTMEQVFDAVSAMKKAYLRLQEAHCPWDPEKMRVADTAVVAEIRRLGVLRERFRRKAGAGGGGGGRSGSGRMMTTTSTIKEVVAPYEAAVEELKREVKAKEVEVENLKEKLKSLSFNGNGGGNGKKGRSLSRKKVSCSQVQGTGSLPCAITLSSFVLK